MSVETDFGPFCCCLGRRSEPSAVIEHPDHGHRTVCESHIRGYEVVDDV